MTTQYTSILKLALPVQGELSGTWGDVVNDNITSMVEEAIAGRAVINTWTTNSHVLTTADGTTSEARCAMLEFTDTGAALTGAATVVCPTASKLYICKNDSGQQVTIKTAAGTGVAIPNGTTMFVFCDGTNVEEVVTNVNTLSYNGYTLSFGGAVTTAGAFTTSGAYSVTLTATGATNVTLPTTGTLATLDGTETLTNKTLTGPTISSPTLTGSISATDVTISGDTTIGDANTDTLTVNATLNSGLVFLDDTYDIGASGATRPRSLYLSQDAVIGDNVSAASADITGAVGIDGNFDINTDKFTVTAATGNTLVAGTLGVSGATTATGGLITDTVSELTAANGVAVDGVILKDSQVSTDQINEKTADAGVTIDSVLLKDDVVNASDIETSRISANDGTTAINIADSTGAVDIDTSLNVDGAVQINSANTLTLRNDTATDADEPKLTFDNDTFAGANHANIRTGNGGLQLFLESPSTSTFQNRHQLLLNGGGSDDFQYNLSTDNGSNYVNYFKIDGGNTIFNNGQNAKDFTVRSDNKANMLYVDGTNDVLGIGTTDNRGFVNIETSAVNYSVGVFSAPHISLQALSQPDDNDGWVGITYATSDSDNYGWSAGAERTTAGNGDFVFTRHVNSETGDERVRFTNGGYVGIGGNPAQMLDLFANNNGATENNTLRFTDTDTATQSGQNSGTIEFYTSDTDAAGVHATIFAEATGTGGSGAIVAKSGAAGSLVENIRMRGDYTVINDGNANTDFRVKSQNQDDAIFVDAANDTVGFFTTDSAPADSASAEGTAVIGNGQLQVSKNGATPVKVNRIGTDGDLVRFQKNGSSGHFGSIGYLGGDFYIGSSAGSGAALRMDGTNDQIYPSNAAGAARDDALNLGASTVRFKNLYLSNAVVQNGVKATTTATTQVAIETFAHADHDGAKVVITAATSADTYVTELLIATNGTTAVATEYGQIGTGSALATYDVDISGADVRILATPASTTSTTFRVAMTLT